MEPIYRSPIPVPYAIRAAAHLSSKQDSDIPKKEITNLAYTSPYLLHMKMRSPKGHCNLSKHKYKVCGEKWRPFSNHETLELLEIPLF